MPEDKTSRLPVIAGLALAGTGVAHFVSPQLFEGVTAPAFPDDPARFIKINGGLETALGLGLAVPQTRKLAIVGLLAYGGYLAVNVLKNR